MRNRAIAFVLGVSVVGGALTSCTSGTSGDPTPAPTTASSPTTTRHPAAPQVAHPLDASALLAQPCNSLTPADISALNIVNAISKAGGGPSDPSGCTWSGDSGGGVSVDWQTANTNGLADLYAKSSTIAYWQPTTVAGYPAAFGDVISDSRGQGDCVLNTAVSNKLYFFVQFDNPLNASQSCTLASQAAAEVIKNLGGS